MNFSPFQTHLNIKILFKFILSIIMPRFVVGVVANGSGYGSIGQDSKQSLGRQHSLPICDIFLLISDASLLLWTPSKCVAVIGKCTHQFMLFPFTYFSSFHPYRWPVFYTHLLSPSVINTLTIIYVLLSLPLFYTYTNHLRVLHCLDNKYSYTLFLCHFYIYWWTTCTSQPKFSLIVLYSMSVFLRHMFVWIILYYYFLSSYTSTIPYSVLLGSHNCLFCITFSLVYL